jgi:hypothetical protein
LRWQGVRFRLFFSALLKLLEENLQLGFTVMKKVAEIISSRLRNTRSQLRSARTEGLITHG